MTEVGAAGGAALAFHAVVLGTFLAASTAPTPLYRFYQQAYALSPVLVTVVFAVYAIALLTSLLVAGSVSDHLSRRPVIFGAVLLEGVAMLLFAVADGVGWLIAARFIQGVATGVAASSLGAALIDVDRVRGQFVNAVMPLLGMGVGALGTSALVQYGPHPLHLVYVILAAVFAAQAGLIWATPETGGRRAGALQALRPRVVVPHQARRALLAIMPLNVATWMLLGFYLSVVPSLVVVATGSRTPLTSGMMVTGLTVAGAAAVARRRSKAATTNLTVGTLAMVSGLIIVLAGMHGGSVPILIGGALVGGVGFGTSYLGALGTIVPLAKPDERAELLSAFYIQGYLAFSLPAVLAGYLVREIGYVGTADIYAAAIIALSTVGAFVRRMVAAR